MKCNITLTVHNEQLCNETHTVLSFFNFNQGDGPSASIILLKAILTFSHVRHVFFTNIHLILGNVTNIGYFIRKLTHLVYRFH